MVSTPSKIFQDIKNNKLDIDFGIQSLITIIETSYERDLRFKSLRYLKLLNKNSLRIFRLLENLLISDSDEQIRAYCANYLRNNFIRKAFSPMKWAIHYERDFYAQIEIIRTLAEINTEESKQLLLNELKKLLAQKYVDDQNRYSNWKFITGVEKLLKLKKLNQLSTNRIAEILINHKTISHFIKRFYFVYFKWMDGLIIELDLSDLGWNVSKPWEFITNKRLNKLSEIPELMNLKYLKKLDLSDNNIENIKELLYCKNLTSLILKNNHLEDPQNIEYLKKMKNLKYINLKGNKLADKINREDLDGLPYLEKLILKDYLIIT
jgi:DNA-binding transcriptional ArsR family regulator